jgi:hypothetical protein
MKKASDIFTGLFLIIQEFAKEPARTMTHNLLRSETALFQPKTTTMQSMPPSDLIGY